MPSLIADARVIINDCNMFIIHATVVYLAYINPKFNKLRPNAKMLKYKNYTCGLYPKHIIIINGGC